MSPTQSSRANCVKCGTIVPSNAPFGQCPHCLLALGRNTPVAPEPDEMLHVGQVRRFGDYELLEELARGGMGVVYRAQHSKLRREVALKMILAGELATPEVVQRFRNEAMAAGRLDHPNIVPVYEIGEYETQHYFSMRLVRGRQNISTWAKALTLSPVDRAARITAMMVKVARAVAFAHERGILHRDVKPSNVLVDENGEPQVTDFGLAKFVTDQDSSLTHSLAALGSPSYMAPEQADARHSDVTMATDVYGLGAVLYELLTGRPPFAGKSPLATAKMVVEEIPAPLTDTPYNLGTICLKCLEKEPRRRYHTAEDLALDLERYLNKEVILARPPTATYLLGTFVRRHTLAFVAGTAVALALIVGTSVALWQAAKAQREKRNAEAQTAQAIQANASAQAEAIRAEKAEAAAVAESHRARQAASFLNQLLDHAAEEIQNGRNPEALKRALDRSASLLSELKNDPTLQGELLERMARFYQAIGENKQAMSLLEARLALLAQLQGEDSREAVEFELSYLTDMDSFGLRAAAPPKLEALKVRLEKKGERGGAFWFVAQRELVRCWIKLSASRSALASSEEAMAEAARQKLTGERLLEVQLSRVDALWYANDFTAALALLEQCQQTALGLEDSARKIGAIKTKLISILQRKGDFVAAVEILRRDLAETEAKKGARHRSLLPQLIQLAQFESSARLHDQAILHAQTALSLARELAAAPGNGSDTFRVNIVNALCQLSLTESAAGRHEEALAHSHEAMVAAQAAGNMALLNEVQKATGAVQRAAGKLEEAYNTYQERINIELKRNQTYKIRSADLYEMVDIRLEQGRPVEAMAVVSDLWARTIADPDSKLHVSYLRKMAENGLRSWAALQKANPETSPPVELSAWQSAADAGRQAEPTPNPPGK